MLPRMAGHSVGWVEGGLAAAMLATAAYCAARLVLPRLRSGDDHQHRVDVFHVVMAAAMAAMLLGVAAPVWGSLLVLVFAVPAVWFAVDATRTGVLGARLDRVQLSVASVAMIYMSGAVPGFGTVSAGGETRILSRPESMQHGAHAMGSTGVTTAVAGIDFALLGAALVGILAAFAVLNIGQLSASADRAATQVAHGVWTRRLTLCCQLAMGATMAHMLTSML